VAAKAVCEHRARSLSFACSRHRLIEDNSGPLPKSVESAQGRRFAAAIVVQRQGRAGWLREAGDGKGAIPLGVTWLSSQCVRTNTRKG